MKSFKYLDDDLMHNVNEGTLFFIFNNQDDGERQRQVNPNAESGIMNMRTHFNSLNKTNGLLRVDEEVGLVDLPEPSLPPGIPEQIG